MEFAHRSVGPNHKILESRIMVEIHGCNANNIPVGILEHEPLRVICTNPNRIKTERIADRFC